MKIGQLEIPNRFIVSPMVMNLCTDDGMATEQYIAYHEAKARGGWGMIVTEDYAVVPAGRAFRRIPGLWKDEQIPGHSELTKRVHAYGTKILAQIYHAGRQTNSVVSGYPVEAPSAISCPVCKELPRELSLQEVKNLVSAYGDCALRAKKAGFDGVQIHGAHGYLVTEFTSPYSNKRTDEYGGSLMNRMRFPLEIIADIRKKCGNDFVIDYKISATEGVQGGLTIEDTKTIAIFLEQAGIDSLNVSMGVYETWWMQVPPGTLGHGWIADYAADIKKMLHIPVTTVGRVNDPLIGETILASGKVDACYMGRASLADPDLPNKARDGRFDEIIHCTGCLQGCIEEICADRHGTCMLHPQTAREHELTFAPAEVKKSVYVIGGGPAGAEAAIVAAQRGHRVTLFEKQDRIGGMLRTASVPPWKGELADFITWQERMLSKLGVDVRLNTEFTPDMAAGEAPDVFIVATGGTPMVPSIPGTDLPFVVSAVDLLNGRLDVNGKIAVIGGGMVGVETANHLASHNNSVTIVEMLPEIAREEPGNTRYFLFKAFDMYHVDIHTDSKLLSINEDRTITVEKGEVKEVLGAFDAVVLALGIKTYNPLKNKLAGDIVYIGDANLVGNAMHAIYDAYTSAMSI